MRTKNEAVTRINITVPDQMYDRIKALSNATGQTYASILQTCVAIGLGNLEPSILGTIERSVKTSEVISQATADMYKVMEKVLLDVAETFKGIVTDSSLAIEEKKE